MDRDKSSPFHLLPGRVRKTHSKQDRSLATQLNIKEQYNNTKTNHWCYKVKRKLTADWILRQIGEI